MTNTLRLREGDAPRSQVVFLFTFFFLIITAFWCMKPLRTAGVVKALGSDLYPLVKQGSLLLVPLVMVIYEMMTNRLSRGKLVFTFTLIFVVMTLGFRVAFAIAPNAVTKVGFFYFVDMYVTVMVTLFWTYLNSVFSSDQAKRYYGIIGSGGLLGGIFGSSIAGYANELLGVNIIIVAGILLSMVLFVITYLEKGQSPQPISAAKATTEKPGFWQSSTEGIRLVMGSRYLLAIVGMVGLYEVTSSLIDYQFNATCAASFTDEVAMAGFQGRVFFVGQILSLVVMTFVTPYVFKRMGILVGLMLLPAALAMGSVAYLFIPILATITATTGAEMSFAYSINQASKEILYVPLDVVTKFKAKAFIDMFIFRFAKAVGGGLILIYLNWFRPLGVKPQYLMLLNALLIGTWLFAIRVASRTGHKDSPKAVGDGDSQNKNAMRTTG